MAFHIHTFGAMSAKLQSYADEEGLVPETGDRWQDFVVQAEAHTAQACQELEDLEWGFSRY